ncbi:YbbR-like domain-containing protein [Persephonella atlantica]|uniref:YbbR-like domain-containing protein n=1 Tax=Persephonella atlantica TaxID=2699429 RepID=A0ABS1GEZ6_9AQUI|nr:YbbR-like domain-containing protein [Persephonella atlantica]MBK3331468.1 YbbR-like domain-containing protein [Persephonella atlantica]
MEKVRKIIFHNLHLKILSLLVAFLLWLNIVSLQKTRFEFYSEVKILNKPSEIKIEKVYPEKVLIVIEGIRSKLDKVNISKIMVYADGRHLKKGKNVLKVFVSPKQTANFKVIEVKPEKVYVYTSTK